MGIGPSRRGRRCVLDRERPSEGPHDFYVIPQWVVCVKILQGYLDINGIKVYYCNKRIRRWWELNPGALVS